jgi:hypothetical protein
MRAKHEPDRHMPLLSRQSGWDTRELGDLRAVHEPDPYVAGDGVPPEKVSGAIAVEVPGADDRGGDGCDARSLKDQRAVN